MIGGCNELRAMNGLDLQVSHGDSRSMVCSGNVLYMIVIVDFV